jgi:hypothetical protein
MSHEIIPPALAISALRDNGYKNAAYAIAELIDNSLQAGATNVQLLCAEVEHLVDVHRRMRIDQIAVADNGCGMDATTLRQALAFGNGTRLNDRSGMGRFGMGLPNSSMSQAARVDVWTWQQSSRPIHSYLDLQEIRNGSIRDVPEPKAKKIPEPWKSSISSSESGTLVVWSNIDRCKWRSARAIIENSEFLIGRMYRHFLQRAEVGIQFVAFNAADPQNLTIDKQAKANDPLYLMADTSCPAPWDHEPMFTEYGPPIVIKTKSKGKNCDVKVQFSVAKPEAREGHNPGRKDHGQHASHNVGVSIVRARRELELQTGWTAHHDPRERWWGAEVNFPPELDEVFGVTNDKQSATSLADIASMDIEELAVREGFESQGDLKEEWERTNDPRLVLLRVKIAIDGSLNAIRQILREQTARGRRELTRHDTAEVKATEATRDRQLQGLAGASDIGESAPAAERRTELAQVFVEAGLEPNAAQEHAVRLLEDNRKYEFVYQSVDTDAFFMVRTKGGAILITLNTDHPAYEHLVALLDQDPGESDITAIRERMRRSHEGLKLLIVAWARYEDELPLQRREDARKARNDWGRVARQFLAND